MASWDILLAGVNTIIHENLLPWVNVDPSFEKQKAAASVKFVPEL